MSDGKMDVDHVRSWRALCPLETCQSILEIQVSCPWDIEDTKETRSFRMNDDRYLIH